LRVFENRVLRRIFGPERDKVTGDWNNCIMRSFTICTLHQEKIRKIKWRVRWAGHVARIGDMRKAHRINWEA
jgi:hypothetical protein